VGHWIRLGSLTEDGVKKLRNDREEMFSNVRSIIEGEGGKLIAAWVTQGRYDIISVIDAPNEQAILSIDAAISGLKIYNSETLPGIPIDSFLAAMKDDHFGLFLEGWFSKKNGGRRR
tara:strand:- start:609 stop:959 length:351 start_codon:yes stop_codon:yes gene_type:complete